MTLTRIRIELPSYSYSLELLTPDEYTILKLKSLIFTAVQGGPRADGQRIIWQGRILADTVVIRDLTKSADDTLVFHLAVHPTAWTGPPPGKPPVDFSQPSPSTSTSPPPPADAAPASPPIPAPSPFAPARMQGPPRPQAPSPQDMLNSYFQSNQSISNAPPSALAGIHHIHNNALLALEQRPLVQIPASVIPSMRDSAKEVLARHGYAWPAIFDEPFPAAQDESNGVKYERVNIQGRDYLKIVTPEATPTPLQVHALKVLTYTFPLLSIPASPQMPYPYPASLGGAADYTAPFPPLNPNNPADINARLQQLGLPPLRAAQPAAEVRVVNVRALIAPILLLLLRTLFLVYFISPFQTPLFGLLVGAWLLYETWKAMRNAIGPPGPRNRAARDAAGGNNNANAPNAPAANGQPAQNGNANANDNANGNHPAQPQPEPERRQLATGSGIPAHGQWDTVLETAARFNTLEEHAALEGHEFPPTDRFYTPAWKLVSFFMLLMATMHPAFWDRRRAILKRREGHVKCRGDIAVGGFNTGKLVVRDFITLHLVPPNPAYSPLAEHLHAHAIRLVTDSFLDSTEPGREELSFSS
ncbi:hypothetical protein EWM64_g3194 [Hericium alpestre]|uniref:Ubiquitin-like domain-containing protein n=1 Tax=Hericium alpestre TaxID=135208 RepID=A0A4Z0A2Z4_9AGAM|nr:hypothetical protein EWM64_g3194 [Hericium alpestre]